MRLLASLFCLLALPFAGAAPRPAKPKLVLAVVIDQFRYDYLTRFGADYKGGIHRLLDNGSLFLDRLFLFFQFCHVHIPNCVRPNISLRPKYCVEAAEKRRIIPDCIKFS